LRKLQKTGKAGCRAGRALQRTRSSSARTFVSPEFQLQQQSQTAVFRPAEIEARSFITPCEKQGAQAPTRHSTAEHSARENNSLCSIASRILSSLRLRHPKNCPYRASGQPTNRSSQRSPAGSSRISSPCCDLPSLRGKYYRRHTSRVFLWTCRTKAISCHKHSEARVSYERSSDSKVTGNAFWGNSKNFRRNCHKCRIWHFSCRRFGLSGSSRADSKIIFNMVRRDGLVSSGKPAVAMGSHVRKSKPVSAFIESQQQGVEAPHWQFFRFSYIRPVGKLFNISNSETPVLLESSDKRLPEGSRPGSRCKKTGCLGRQRVEKGYEALEELQSRQYFKKATESGCPTNTKQIQDSCGMWTSVGRQVYDCFVQKPQKEVVGGLVFRKKSRNNRADKQPSGEGFAKACNLAKNFTGQQVSQWTDFCPEINDNYYFSQPAGSECNGISGNHAEKFSIRVGAAKAVLKSCCIKQQNQFPYSALEKRKIFEQSDTCAKISSCDSHTT